MSTKSKKISREDAATYAIQHNIRGTLNEMLNLTLRQMPAEDPIRYLADLLESRERDSGILEAEVEHRTDSMGKPGLVVSIRTSKRNTSFAFSCVDRSSSCDSMYMDGGIVDDKKIRKRLARRTEEDIERLADMNAEKLQDIMNEEKKNIELCKEVSAFLKKEIFPKIIGESPKDHKLLDVTLKSAFEKYASPSTSTDDEDENETKENVTETTPVDQIFRVAVLAVSIAIWKAAAKEKKKSMHEFVANSSRGVDSIMMPVPIVPVLSGGVYSQNEIPFDSLELVPIQFKSYSSAIEACVRIQRRVRSILNENKMYFSTCTSSGSTEGFGFDNVVDALKILHKAIEAEKEKGNVKIGISASADRYYRSPPPAENEEAKRRIGT